MNASNSNVVPANQLRPGTVLRVPSNIVGVMHWGVVGYGHDSNGLPFVWHSQKADVLRATPFLEFSGGKTFEILWVPENNQQAARVIQKLKSKEGLPWHLTQANCEMVVRWAVEDKAVSHQLGFGFLALVGLVVLIAVATD